MISYTLHILPDYNTHMSSLRYLIEAINQIIVLFSTIDNLYEFIFIFDYQLD